jgi:hypothetical protein
MTLVIFISLMLQNWDDTCAWCSWLIITFFSFSMNNIALEINNDYQPYSTG